MIESSSPAAEPPGAVEATLSRPHSTPQLAGFSWPALVLVGAEDTITPPDMAAAMQRQIPRSRLVTLPAAGAPLEPRRSAGVLESARGLTLQSNM